MRHLTDSELALASRGDLPFVPRLKAKAHCLSCEDCRQRVEQYKSDRERVAKAVEAFELPRSIHWDELEGEMFANIRLGLEVDEIGGAMAAPAHRSVPLGWRVAAATAAIAVTVATGWFLAGPGAPKFAPQAVAQVRSGALVLRGDSNGIGVENRGVGMILRNASAPRSRFEVGLDGSVKASTVDTDSGQITVSQVYVE